MNRLNQLTTDLHAETVALRNLLLNAAVTEARHKSERAKAMLRHKASGSTVAMAEAAAEAECADFLLERLTAAAIADSQKEMVRTLRAEVDAEQTERADHRAADAAMSRGYSGAA